MGLLHLKWYLLDHFELFPRLQWLSGIYMRNESLARLSVEGDTCDAEGILVMWTLTNTWLLFVWDFAFQHFLTFLVFQFGIIVVFKTCVRALVWAGPIRSDTVSGKDALAGSIWVELSYTLDVLKAALDSIYWVDILDRWKQFRCVFMYGNSDRTDRLFYAFP